MAMLPVSFNAEMFVDASQINLPDNVRQGFGDMMSAAFAGMSSGGFRRIVIGKTGFQLVDGGGTVDVPADQLYGVCVGASACNYAVWYARAYQPGQEPEAPDLIWNLNDRMDNFPAALPAKYREKIGDGPTKRWGFQIRKRLAFALLRPAANGGLALDTDNPYVLDITSMSIFGKGAPQANMYKWSGLRSICMQHSAGGVQVTPAMFMVQIVLDPNVAVPGVVSFKPHVQNGRLMLLNPSLMQAVYDCMTSPATQELLQIKEKLDYAGAQQAAPAPQPKPAPAPKPAPQPAPQAQPAQVTEQLLQQAQAAAKQQAQPDGRLAQAQAMMDEAKPAPAPEAAQAQQANVTDLLNQLNF